jgi:site-specific DNA-methyltransferase (adenine-specific)
VTSYRMMPDFSTPDGSVMLYHGDAIEVLRSLPRGIADLVATDPPFSSGGLFRGDRAQPTAAKYVDGRTETFRPDFAGDNRDQRSYFAWSTLWLSEALKATRPGGIAAVFSDWRQVPTTTDAIQAGGWVWRGIGVWDKTEAARPAKGRYRSQCEFLCWGSAGNLGKTNIESDAHRPCLPGVWRQAVVGKHKKHQTAKPVNVMEGIIAIAPPAGVVIDPFMGSGTTGVACVNTGRVFIGVEQSEEYFSIAVQEIRHAWLNRERAAA